MNQLTNFLRANAGRKSVPAYYDDHLSEKLKLFENIFKSDFCEFDTDKKMKERRPVVWADAAELLEAVVEHRNQIGNFHVKLMADGGQKFFKMSMTIIPENYSPEVDGEENESISDNPDNMEKRTLYCEGGSIGKKAKLKSVKRLILLCVVPEIKETYDNVKLLFQLTNINNIPFKLVCDFKLLLIINGQQTASAMFPCPYCFINLDNLKNFKSDFLSDDDDEEQEENLSSENLKVSSDCLKLKTFGDLRKDYEKYCTMGNNKKFAKQCHSTINFPLLDESDETLVIEKCVPPQLHLHQGFVNHLFWSGLVPLLGEEKALLWPKKLNLIQKNYQGGIFEGNQCRELLKKADLLNDSEICSDIGILPMVPFIAAFKAMDKIVNCCFSTKKVEENLDDYIGELKTALKATEVSETLKIHVILDHLKNGLHFLNGFGLGLWSEQAGESIHREFLSNWMKYKINSLDHPSYLEHLKKAAVEFSSLHI